MHLSGQITPDKVFRQWSHRARSRIAHLPLSSHSLARQKRRVCGVICGVHDYYPMATSLRNILANKFKVAFQSRTCLLLPSIMDILLFVSRISPQVYFPILRPNASDNLLDMQIMAYCGASGCKFLVPRIIPAEMISLYFVNRKCSQSTANGGKRSVCNGHVSVYYSRY